jgi:hypothetical protein
MSYPSKAYFYILKNFLSPPTNISISEGSRSPLFRVSTILFNNFISSLSVSDALEELFEELPELPVEDEDNQARRCQYSGPPSGV